MKCNVQTQFKPTGKMRKAMLAEIDAQIVERTDRYVLDLESMILYTLHTEFGFGKARLERFYDAYAREFYSLRNRFEMDDCYPARRKLLEIGVDVEELEKRYGAL